MANRSLFVRPRDEVYRSPTYAYHGSSHTYGHYNYLRPGLIPRLKRYRFEVALRLARPYFGDRLALDFGCADGVLLPSLAQRFSRVVALDTDEQMLAPARALVEALSLRSVRVINNAGMTVDAMRAAIGEPAGVIFLLETLEHVGDPARLYASKVEFLDGLFSLLEPRGAIIVSVPKMVGVPFLLKYGAQWALRLPHEHQSPLQLLKSGLLKDTEDLEPRWSGGHNGFNNAKLARHLEPSFDIVARHDMFFSEFYVLRRCARQ